MSRAGARVVRLLAGAGLQMAAAAVLAHASLVESVPADGAMLERTPAQVRLRFNEGVTPLRLTLLSPDGTTRVLDAAPAEPDGVVAAVGAVPVTAASAAAATAAATATATPARGTYLLSWRVVSADGHPVGGALTWSVAAVSSVAEAERPSSTAGLPVAIWLTRLLLYIGLIAGIGGALFDAFMSTAAPGVRRTTRLGLAIALAALAIAVGLQGLDALAAPWSALSSGNTWAASLRTSYGITAVLLLVALLAAATADRPGRSALRRACASFALLAAAAAIAASGHASVAPPRWLARPGVFVHVGAVTLWIGSLWPLLLSLRASPQGAALARFSRAAPWVVLAVVASGAVLSLLQLDLPRPILSTAYGQVWAAKMLLVVALLGIASINRFRLTARVQRGDVDARRRMRQWIGAEIALAVVVLTLVAVWRLTPPPRSLGSIPSPVRMAHLQGAGASADLAVAAQGDGRWLACASLAGPGVKTLDPNEVVFVWSTPAADAEPLRRAARRQQDGRWCTDAMALPSSGRWHVAVEAVVSDFERVRVEGEVDLERR